VQERIESATLADEVRTTEVTEEMIEAGVSAWEKLGEAMEAREASDNPEELPDYDEGEVVTTIFRAMRAAALRTTTPASDGRPVKPHASGDPCAPQPKYTDDDWAADDETAYLELAEAAARHGAAPPVRRNPSPTPRSVRVAELSDDDLEAIRAAEPSDSQIATDGAVDEDALAERLREEAEAFGGSRFEDDEGNRLAALLDEAADRLQSQQASIRVRDAALLPLADEMEGLLPYLAAHHFKINSLAKVVADARAALADTTKGGD
jgi:hypothetical protein